jgi:hypothetical protein
MSNLSEEDIMKMEAGPDLDRLIAEKVMGFTLYTDLFYMYRWNDSRHLNFPCDLNLTILQFNPSRNIKMAWEVIEKIKDSFILNLCYTDEWCCHLLQFDQKPGETEEDFAEIINIEINATAKTAPEAISKAALLALMEGER